MLPLSEELKIYEAWSLSDFLFLRRLRNAVRHFMTNDTSRITLIQQICFYFKKPAHIRIYIGVWDGQRVGYVLLRETGQAAYVTEAVAEDFRGKGIASALLTFAQGKYPGLVAEIWPDNAASIALHKRSGFQFEAEKDGRQIYRWRASVTGDTP